MRGLKKQRRVQVILISLLCLTLATILIGFSLRKGINFFMSPTEVVANPPKTTETFRIGGLVVEGSIQPAMGIPFTFDVTDGGNTLSVNYVGTDLRPDLFEAGQGTIAKGRLVEGIFHATEILAKHDETYMPTEVIDALKKQGVYKDPDN